MGHGQRFQQAKDGAIWNKRRWLKSGSDNDALWALYRTKIFRRLMWGLDKCSSKLCYRYQGMPGWFAESLVSYQG